MTRRTVITLGCLLGALLLGLAVAWFLSTHERVAREVDLPRTGEARTNPLFALKLALARDDVAVNSRRRLQLFADGRDEPAVKLGARDTVVIYNDPRTLAPREVDGLLDWVDAGGHLIVRTPPAGVFERSTGEVPLLSALELVLMGSDANDCEAIRLAPVVGKDAEPVAEAEADAFDEDADNLDYLFCDGRRFNLDGANPVHSWGDLQAGYVFARVPYGEGSVDVLADMDFMGSDELEGRGARALTRQLLAPNHRAGTVHLVYAAQMPSLWKTLVAHSWMAWGPLLLAFLAWLWRRMQRFGPQLPAPDDARRSLMEHIVASGEHIYRYGYAHHLYAAVREAFMARLRRRDPQAAALVGEPQLALLQARFPDVPASQIRDALVPPFAHDHASFRSRIATLIRLRNRL